MSLPFAPQSGPVSLHALRHSVSHVMADAVLRLFPGAQVAIPFPQAARRGAGSFVDSLGRP